MRQPLQRGAAIDQHRMTGWINRFRFYRASPNQQEIEAWLDRFQVADRDLAARLLDCVEVISEPTIQQGYRDALTSLEGWHSNPAEREGRWFFTGFGGPSESGMAMLRIFREANNLNAPAHNHLFCTVSDIPSKKLTAEDTIVIVDDFSGTGKQICDRWPVLYELIASDAKPYLILTAATDTAAAKIAQETTLQVVTQFSIHKNENVFASTCRRFTQADRDAILPYCEKADKKHPNGFGECGLLYVLSHKTPNNSIPILHSNHKSWKGLFPRNLQQSG
jgi:hypothetical protein